MLCALIRGKGTLIIDCLFFYLIQLITILSATTKTKAIISHMHIQFILQLFAFIHISYNPSYSLKLCII